VTAIWSRQLCDRAPLSPHVIAVAVVAAVAAGGCASDQRFPSAPILLVCPWAAGGGSDRVARQLATLLEQDLDVPVNVINVTGGDGVTGHSRGALARPDGYTMTLITVEIATLHWRQMTNIGPRDFAPLGLVNRDAAAVFVRSDAPWQTLRDLEQAIRDAPATLRASGTATAGIWHLALAGWLTAVGLEPTDVIWVSIAGAAPSLQELIAGGIDLVACSLAEARALLDAGRIRSLGVMADERLPQFPLVPTLKEQGVDFSLGTIRALAVPRDVPRDRVHTLAEAVGRVVQSDAYRSSLSSAGFTPAYEEPAVMTRTLEDTDARLGALLRSEAFETFAAKQVGPMFFPAMLFTALAGVTLGLLALSRAARARDGVTASPEAVPAVSRPAGWRFVEPLLWIVLYIALAEWAGFLLTAGVLLLLYLIRLGTRIQIALPLTLALVPVTYYVFAGLLRVPLPRGVFGW
jgi:tripartite-type tricarboxylate transporter receptor subunit TctC